MSDSRIRTTNEMFITPWSPEWHEHDMVYRFRATAGLHYIIGNTGAYFSVTGETVRRHPSRKVWKEDSFGMLHDEVKSCFPDLEFMLKYHHFCPGKGPMHYLANGEYWLSSAISHGKYHANDRTPEQCMDSFKSTVLWGSLPDDGEIPMPSDKSTAEIEGWKMHLKSVLEDRLPRLLDMFEEDYYRFKQLSILTPTTEGH